MDDFDIKPGQTTNNYVYDAIGNLVQDKLEHLQILGPASYKSTNHKGYGWRGFATRVSFESYLVDDFDIKPGQTTNNYVYDAIGNLVQDKLEHLQILVPAESPATSNTIA